MAGSTETRLATVADAASIAEVQVSAWKAAYRGLLPEAALERASVEDRTARWQEILAEESGTTLVGVADGRVIGWSGFGVSRDDDRDKSVGEVYGFYVHPDAWRAGVGRTMWLATVEQLATDGFASADVWCLEENWPARRFYKAMGCELDERAEKSFEVEEQRIPEVRYFISTDLRSSDD